MRILLVVSVRCQTRSKLSKATVLPQYRGGHKQRNFKAATATTTTTEMKQKGNSMCAKGLTVQKLNKIIRENKESYEKELIVQ